ncbi:uncharacterized protein LOC143560836 [Bidens hawaiensis]|uniref:uncharacterized protein LOC143560836 n=1 Tax=Bidens hawaiensis TaxID=980011 RepID=UPI00404A21DD
MAAIVWDHVSRWCKVPPIFGFSVRDVSDLHKSIKLGVVEKEAFHGIVIIACWEIWKAKNEKVFAGKEVKIEEIIGYIKLFAFLWYKHRSKKRPLDWSSWCKFELM